MAKMKLIKYKVEKFKSVMNSGWIDCNDVTTLVGVNEAGKSNLLLALWKLNPAKGGKISLSDDMPVKFFSDMRLEKPKAIFITAEFEIVDNDLLGKISELCKCKNCDSLKSILVSRDYDNNLHIDFPNFEAHTTLTVAPIVIELNSYLSKLNALREVEIAEPEIINEIENTITSAIKLLDNSDVIDMSSFSRIKALFTACKITTSQSSDLQALFTGLQKYIAELYDEFNTSNPSKNADVIKLITTTIPKFVYYSNYGNLDSEIYLPHVIENMQRPDLPVSLEAKTRTLKVLFEYVKLDPNEILEMGLDAQNATESEIKEKGEQKKQRDILLQSASTKLTREFREWWKQGEYIFDLAADGKHFRIWVSDTIRPEKIVLENRSTGLQWFLSFYLVFLVESQDSHSGAILLLDEAGLSLHPLAQKTLSMFFSNLANTNQIINTTHSPFIIDTNNIDKAKVVYVDKEGYTVASNDLRATQDKLNVNSIYAIHSALGLSVSDILLQGCKPVIVEGTSDQHYLNAIKLFLISKNIIAPKEELIFVPSGGVKAVSSIASLLSAKADMPYIILDSDRSGQDYCNKLTKELYKDIQDKVIMTESITSIANSEIEDLIPYKLLARAIDRLFNTDLDFGEYYNENNPLIPQIEAFAKENDIELPQGYKVDLAKHFKQLLSKNTTFNEAKYIDMWKSIFEKLCV